MVKQLLQQTNQLKYYTGNLETAEHFPIVSYRRMHPTAAAVRARHMRQPMTTGSYITSVWEANGQFLFGKYHAQYCHETLTLIFLPGM